VPNAQIGKDHRDTFPLTDECTGQTVLLDCVNERRVIRYLSAPLGRGKIRKMKWCQKQIVKMEGKETILAESGLKITHVIDAIKTFVLPMAEFLLRHSNLSLPS
jgi:hypothetical protein